LKDAGKGTHMCEPIMRVVVGRRQFRQTYENCPNHPGSKLRGTQGCHLCGMNGIRSLREPYEVKTPRRVRRRRAASAV